MVRIYLLHGKGGSPQGSVSKLEPLLRGTYPDAIYDRPQMPHHDPDVPAEVSVDYLAAMDVPQQSVVVGISLGGLVAAKLQELSRPDLRVACVSSPTWADGVRLERHMENRVAIYSSNDEVIADRVSDWPALADAHDLPWLSHDTDAHKERICGLLTEWMGDLKR